MTTVHTVIFDVGMTLLMPEGGFEDVAVEVLGHEIDIEADVRSTIGPAWKAWDDAWKDGDGGDPHVGDADVEDAYWKGLYRSIYGALGFGSTLPGDLDAIAAAGHEHFSSSRGWVPFPETRALIDALETAGVRIGILSNWGHSLRRILDDHDLTRRFEQVTISAEVGIAKPDHRVFDLTLEAMDVTAEPGVAYVGDSVAHDIVPASAMGMRAVLIDRFDRHEEDAVGAASVGPVHRVPHLAAIPEAIGIDAPTVPEPPPDLLDFEKRRSEARRRREERRAGT